MPKHLIKSKAEFLNLLYLGVRCFQNKIIPEDYLEGIYDGMRPLHIAVALKDTYLMKFLIKCGVNVNALDRNGNTALHHCSVECEVELAKILVEAGANVSCVNPKQLEPIHLAKEGHDFNNQSNEYVHFLVQSGAKNTAGPRPLYTQKGNAAPVLNLTSCLPSNTSVNILDQRNKCEQARHKTRLCKLQSVGYENAAYSAQSSNSSDLTSTISPAAPFVFFNSRTMEDVDIIQKKEEHDQMISGHMLYRNDLSENYLRGRKGNACLTDPDDELLKVKNDWDHDSDDESDSDSVELSDERSNCFLLRR